MRIWKFLSGRYEIVDPGLTVTVSPLSLSKLATIGAKSPCKWENKIISLSSCYIYSYIIYTMSFLRAATRTVSQCNRYTQQY